MLLYQKRVKSINTQGRYYLKRVSTSDKRKYPQLIHLDGKRMERIEKMGKAHLEPKECSPSSGRMLACMDRNGRKGLGIAYKVDLVGSV